jgi:hypothetical protein
MRKVIDRDANRLSARTARYLRVDHTDHKRGVPGAVRHEANRPPHESSFYSADDP